MKKKLEYKEEWRGEHEGITFLISRHSNHDRESCWCFYILLPIEAIPEAERGAWVVEADMDVKPWARYDYTESRWADLVWHGGITYYDCMDGEVIKAGCDYSHLFDEGCHYDVEELAHDARACIDSLRERLAVRWRSNWDGSWHATEADLDAHDLAKREAAK